MPSHDADRWNRRYSQGDAPLPQHPRQLLIENRHYLPDSGLVLDVAMGQGASAGFLTNLGYRVVGVDIASRAVQEAKLRNPALRAMIADLTSLCFPDRIFDVILNFYYLERRLLPAYHEVIKPGGLIYFETLTIEMRKIKPDIDCSFLLQPGELKDAFAGWDFLKYFEGIVQSDHGHTKAIASLVARAPA